MISIQQILIEKEQEVHNSLRSFVAKCENVIKQIENQLAPVNKSLVAARKTRRNAQTALRRAERDIEASKTEVKINKLRKAETRFFAADARLDYLVNHLQDIKHQKSIAISTLRKAKKMLKAVQRAASKHDKSIKT